MFSLLYVHTNNQQPAHPQKTLHQPKLFYVLSVFILICLFFALATKPASAETFNYSGRDIPLIFNDSGGVFPCPASVGSIKAVVNRTADSRQATISIAGVTLTADVPIFFVSDSGEVIDALVAGPHDVHTTIKIPLGDGITGEIVGVSTSKYTQLASRPEDNLTVVVRTALSGYTCQYQLTDSSGTWTNGSSQLAKNYGNSTNDKDASCNSSAKPCTLSGEPIDAGTGNEFETELDFNGVATTGLSLTRYYNSQDTTKSPFGTGWHGTWQRGLVINGSVIMVTRADGRKDNFTQDGSGSYVADADVTSRLVAATDANGSTIWNLVLADDSVETYAPNGDLVNVTTRAGLVTTLAYDANNFLTSVTGPFGHMMRFAYDGSGRITSMTAPDGGMYRYTYNTSNNLVSVTYPDSTKKQYVYENTSFANALTGIIDENNIRYVTIAYDTQGRATSSQLAGGAERTTLTYNADGSTKVTDANGNAHTFSFASQYGLTKATAMSGAPLPGVGGSAFTYDTNGFLASRTDYNGNVTAFTHDERGNETSRTEAAGTSLARTTSLAWHPTLHLPVQIVAPTGRTTVFDYDAHGNRIGESIVAGSQQRNRTWVYNAQGQVLTETDALGRVTTYAYDTLGNLASKIDALGHVTKYTAYDGAGRLLSMTDPNGLVTRYVYNARGRMTSRNAGGEVTSYVYDTAGNRLRTIMPDGAYTTYVYDQAHRLTHVADALNNQLAYALDGNSNRTNIRSFDSTGHAAMVRSFSYDNVNRVAAETGAEGQTIAYDYDEQGNLTSISGPLGHETQFAYDALNRRVASRDAAGGLTRYGYDPLDRLTAEADPRNLTTGYGYDEFDDPTEVASPDAGPTAKIYDAVGNVLSSTDARGKVTHYGYDALNRPVLAHYADGSQTRYNYDQGKYGTGHLTRVIDASGVTDYSYDPHGRLTQKAQRIGGLVLVTRRSYDKFGRLATLTYPSGRQVNVNYNANGQINGLSMGRSWLITNAAYQPFGPVVGWRQGNNGLYLRGFDLDGRITGITMGGTALIYGYDAANRITGIGEAGQPGQSFGYDALDRLTGVAEAGHTTSYAYDANGNRLKLTNATPATSSVYAYAANSNRLLSVVTGLAPKIDTDAYTYDTTGNILADGTHVFTYDARGRLAATLTYDDKDDKDGKNGKGDKDKDDKGKDKNGKDKDRDDRHSDRDHDEKLTTHYLINGLGERVAKISREDATAYVYDESGHLLGQYDDKGRDATETIWLGDLPVAVIGGDGGNKDDVRYISPDHLGAPHIITDTRNRKVWEWYHAPFGDTEPATTEKFQYDLRFPGQIHDEETGLNYNMFRDYDPSTGRYIQSDPIGLAAGMNTYGYVRQNPLTYFDPYGLDTYVINRDLSFFGNQPEPRTDAWTHTFVVTTNPDGSISHTYSWGNSSNPRSWNLDQPLDINTAQQALKNGWAQKAGNSDLDPFIWTAFNDVNTPENQHQNLFIIKNCKTEAGNLLELAWKLHDSDPIMMQKP